MAQSIAAELKEALSHFNKGIKEVTIENGVVSVHVKSQRTAFAVQLDLLRSRAFSSVKIGSCAPNGFIVEGVK